MGTMNFEPANGLLGDHGALQKQYLREGYLFFEGVLDVGLIEQARVELVGSLTAQGIVDPDTPGSRATGLGIDAIDVNTLYALPTYDNVVTSTELQALADAVFGEPVSIYRSTNLRYALPADAIHQSPPHQDAFFVGPHEDFRTLWIPLMDIDEAMGGLAVARGSHVPGLRAHAEQDGVYSYVMKGRKQKGVALEEVKEEWLTASYRQGDVLVFHCHAIHRGLPNTSDQVRLSLDVRCQPAWRPLNFQARTPLTEIFTYRADVKKVADDIGLSEREYEVVMIDMLKYGHPATLESVRRVAGQ